MQAFPIKTGSPNAEAPWRRLTGMRRVAAAVLVERR
jgi:hypothetical protein